MTYAWAYFSRKGMAAGDRVPFTLFTEWAATLGTFIQNLVGVGGGARKLRQNIGRSTPSLHFPIAGGEADVSPRLVWIGRGFRPLGRGRK